MASYILKSKPLNKNNFADFGDVIDPHSHEDIREINYGMTRRFNNMANLDIVQNNGQPIFNIFMSRAVVFPFSVKAIERHPLSSQLFFPLTRQPFLVLVAKPDDPPTPESLELFITNGSQGIDFKSNTWHHYLLSLNHDTNFIVIDRGGDEDNCDEFFFDDDIVIKQV